MERSRHDLRFAVRLLLKERAYTISSARAVRDLRPVLREGVALVVAGLVVGLLGAFAIRQAMESQLYGVTGWSRRSSLPWPPP